MQSKTESAVQVGYKAVRCPCIDSPLPPAHTGGKNYMYALKSVLKGKTESNHCGAPFLQNGCFVAPLLCQAWGLHTEVTQSQTPDICDSVQKAPKPIDDTNGGMCTSAEGCTNFHDSVVEAHLQGPVSKGFWKEVSTQLWPNELAFEMSHGKAFQVQETKREKQK